MSSAALSLLTSADDSAAEGETPKSASQHAIALLEGRAEPGKDPNSAPSRSKTRDEVGVGEVYSNDKGQPVIKAKYPSLDRYAESASTGKLFGGMAQDLVGGVAHGVGTLVDVATGTGPGEGSYAEKFASPFQHEPTRLDQLDPEQVRWHEMATDTLNETIGTGPLAQTVRERVPQAAEAITAVVPFLRATGARVSPLMSPKAPIAPIEDVVGKALSKQSMGAAAAVPSRLMTASPDLQAAIRAEARQGGVNPEALDRHLEADSLPVKVRLTKGQATQDPVLISDEMNRRGKDPEFASRFNEQNQQLIDNLDEIRRETSPGVVGNDPIQNGQQIVDSYKTIDQAARDEIAAAYKAARDVNGGELPMDAQAFTKAADVALKKNMKARYVPSEIAADLAEIRETGSMNFETFENLRTNLAAEARKAERSGDGNAAAAVNLVRDAIENVEPLGKAKEVKPLFDKARSMAKARFDRLRADPAYKAAIEDSAEIGQASPLADQFVEKYIVKGKGAHLDRMRENLSNDAAAHEVISAAALNYLKAKSGVNLYTNEGNFSQAGFNRALSEITPKIDRLLSPQAAEQVQTLGNVSRYVQAQPRGSFVNNSNTTVAAHAANIAKGAVERGVNAILPGADLGTLGREKLARRAEKKEVEEALKPGAGIGMKPKKDQP